MKVLYNNFQDLTWIEVFQKLDELNNFEPTLIIDNKNFINNSKKIFPNSFFIDMDECLLNYKKKEEYLSIINHRIFKAHKNIAYDLLSRFSYKSFYAFGGFSIFFVIYSFYKNYLKLIEDNNLFLFLFLLFSNLLIFLWLPAELSYLQLAIICVYLFIIRYSQKKLIYLILIYNFATWIINPEFLVIKYKQMESMCSPKQAIKADLKFSLDKGYYFKYMNTRKMINCFAPGDTERNKRIRQGLSIR